MAGVEMLSIAGDGGERERLAVRLDLPTGRVRPAAILYLHGFGSRQSGEKGALFRARALATGWPFGALDFRGHGASGGALERLTLSRNLRDVEAARALLATRGHPRVALFGSSMGAATALWHAALVPAGVVAVAGIAPALGFRAALERWAGPERLARWRRDGTVRFESELVSTDLGWSLMDDLDRYPAAELARLHRVPALLFQGERDPTVDSRDVAAFAAAAPAGTVDLRLLPDGDHRLVDRLEAIWEATADWFGRHAGGG
jgi:pimeloyl-ACP methyl ester carboxylesterase